MSHRLCQCQICGSPADKTLTRCTRNDWCDGTSLARSFVVLGHAIRAFLAELAANEAAVVASESRVVLLDALRACQDEVEDTIHRLPEILVEVPEPTQTRLIAALTPLIKHARNGYDLLEQRTRNDANVWK